MVLMENNNACCFTLIRKFDPAITELTIIFRTSVILIDCNFVPLALRINWLVFLSSNNKVLFPTKYNETSSEGSLHLPMFLKIEIC